MSRTAESILAEIEELKDRIEALEDEIQDARDRPKTFEVVLKVDTSPGTWGIDIDEHHLWTHFNQFMQYLKVAIHFDDEGDEIKVLSVKEVTSDNA
jgi:hypothetical protein